MANYEQIANLMLGNQTDLCNKNNTVDNYYNAYNVSESTLIKRRALRNYYINEPVVNNFYKNPYFQMKDKRVSYVTSTYNSNNTNNTNNSNNTNNQYMIIENINEGSLDVYIKYNNGWAHIKYISDKNNCNELLQTIK